MEKKVKAKKKVKVKVKDKSLAKVPKEKKKPIVKLNDTNSLIEYALKNKSGIESLKEILKMKHEEEARESERLFHINFCEMQAEFPVIPKTKQVNTKAKVKMYAYAPLSTIIPMIKNIIADHGFSYRWTKEFPAERKIKINFHLTGYGHTETCSMELPIMPQNDYVNSIQQSGSTSTYGERYTLCDMLGIVSDEDDDGRGSESKPAESKTITMPKDKSKEEPKNIIPSKPVKPSVRDDLQNDIKALCTQLGCVTVEDAQTMTGVKSLDDTDLELLGKIKVRLETLVKKQEKK